MNKCGGLQDSYGLSISFRHVADCWRIARDDPILHQDNSMFPDERKRQATTYPLVNIQKYGKSPFFMGKLTINGHVQ